MRRSNRYFPLVGWLLATILAAVYSVTQPFVGNSPASCLLIILSLLMTGALVLALLSKFILLSALAEQGSFMVRLFIAYRCFGQWQSA